MTMVHYIMLYTYWTTLDLTAMTWFAHVFALCTITAAKRKERWFILIIYLYLSSHYFT